LVTRVISALPLWNSGSGAQTRFVLNQNAQRHFGADRIGNFARYQDQSYCL